jgi:hypothetical protein
MTSFPIASRAISTVNGWHRAEPEKSCSVDVARNVTSHAPSNLAEAGAPAGAASVEVGEKRAAIAASRIPARNFIPVHPLRTYYTLRADKGTAAPFSSLDPPSDAILWDAEIMKGIPV